MHTSLVCIPSHSVCEGSFEGTESVLIVLGSVLKALVRLLPSPSRYPSLCVCVYVLKDTVSGVVRISIQLLYTTAVWNMDVSVVYVLKLEV